MSNLQQSDWILAGRFVDGDLPRREAAAVESRMKSDAEFAAAVSEIRAQSNLIGGLPRFKPSEDLADRTLQTSLDQVKAIMGAWPIESSTVAASPERSATQDSFDWKSTAALVASLAGVLMIGVMLWQNNNRSASGVAMTGTASSAPLESAFKGTPDQAGSLADSVMQAEQLKSDDSRELETPSFAGKGAVDDIVSLESRKVQAPKIGALSGTPMKQSVPRSKGNFELAANSSPPVEQIWCIRQDSNASRNVVGDILNLNQIQVQPKAEQTEVVEQDSFEAFYVAATPKQMKQAIAQLSNSANIEMIQLPGGQDSLIADVIQKQFAESNSPPVEEEIDADSADMPSAFPTAASQALAQQLVSNAIPRNMSLPNPVPPILKSGSPIEGLSQTVEDTSHELAANSGAQQRALTPAPGAAVPGIAPKKKSGGAGFGGMGGIAKAAPQETMQNPVRQTVQQAVPAAQEGELGKYLDASDKQLRQYLILVSGGEE
jgi:hypothetical protein